MRDPIKPTLKPPESERLILTFDDLLSFFCLLQLAALQLGGLTALKTLSLSGNQLTSVPAELGNLTALKWLNLAINQLTSVPASFGRLSALETLRLEDNQLRSVPAELGNLTSLKFLNLLGNSISSLPEEVEALRDSNGGICRIQAVDNTPLQSFLFTLGSYALFFAG